ncbi:hypothetical protein H2201_008359 [Coniosporium apollinis]|uniref:Ubiquitin 3 binding protein But2 C-terminal domain-containing protein n=2 Tax=Coniosporium TaxID=2810619 RepID=A0ABQ9NN36_9PEZI|nr:hypothetical protein H2199_004863 [Cladosporium sp. JES 115]KAJ9656956.1 hypothetical protein H2201_008359 [Coniosporium apollinis]
MMKFLSLSCLVLSALTSASAIPSDDDDKKAGECKQRGKERTYVAKYDDLPFTESPDDPTPIGTNYLGLKYTNFFVDAYDGGINPSSGSNVAISYDCGAAPRSIAVAKPGDNFDLLSTYIACNAGYPQGDCRTTVTGTRKNGNKVSQELVYPALDSSVPLVMTKVEFTNSSKWKDLVNVNFGPSIFVDEYGDERCAAFQIDDFTYAKKDCT